MDLQEFDRNAFILDVHSHVHTVITYVGRCTLCYDTFIPLTCACHYKGRMCTFIVSRDKDTVRGLIECPSQWSVISSVNMMCSMSSDIIPLSPFDLIVSL